MGTHCWWVNCISITICTARGSKSAMMSKLKTIAMALATRGTQASGCPHILYLYRSYQNRRTVTPYYPCQQHASVVKWLAPQKWKDLALTLTHVHTKCYSIQKCIHRWCYMPLQPRTTGQWSHQLRTKSAPCHLTCDGVEVEFAQTMAYCKPLQPTSKAGQSPSPCAVIV